MGQMRSLKITVNTEEKLSTDWTGRPIHPGPHLKKMLNGISVKLNGTFVPMNLRYLADGIDVPLYVLADLFAGKIDLNPDLAFRLGTVLDVSPLKLMEAQIHYDLSKVKDKFKASDKKVTVMELSSAVRF